MFVTLPVGLKLKVDEVVPLVPGNQRIMLNNAYRFFHQTISDTIRLKGIPCDFVNYNTSSLRGMLGRNAIKLVEVFEQNEMIEVDSTAVIGKKAYGYCINSTFLDDEYTTLYIPNDLSCSADAATEAILRQCSIDESLAKDTIYRYVNSPELFNQIKLDTEIKNEFLGRVKVFSAHRYRFKDLLNINKAFLLEKFGTDGFSLVKQDKRYYYMPFDMFIQMRRRSVLFSYHDALGRFVNGDIHTSRDEKGNRLHSNITNMATLLAKLVTFEGEYLVEIDMVNSQWCFLVYCLRNPHMDNIISNAVAEHGFDFESPTYRKFREMTGMGTLYEWVQHKLTLNSREEAKEMLFEVLFGTRRRTDRKRILRTIMPEVVDFLDNLKSEQSYKEIPRTLQRVEAHVMIDTILHQLHEEQIPALSKHDAILLPESYYLSGKEIIVNILDNTLGEYRLKISPPYTP